MLPKKNRLTKTTDFDRLKKGKKMSAQHVRVFYLPGESEESRIGLIVSKSVSSNASARNKAKRAIREAIRRIFYQLNGTWDIVVIANPSIARAYTSDIMNDVEQVFQKSRLLK